MEVFVLTPDEPVAPKSTELADMVVVLVTPAEPVTPNSTELADMDVVVVTLTPNSTELADMDVVVVTPTAPVAPKTRKVRCCKVMFPPPIVNHILISFFML
jgi:hypothetical protein